MVKNINATLEQYSARKFNHHSKFLFPYRKMKLIFQYIRQFVIETNSKAFALITLFTAILVFINYHFNLNGIIVKNNVFLVKLFAWYVVFLVAFAIPYLIYHVLRIGAFLNRPLFLSLLLFAPAVFAIKISFDIHFHFTDSPGWNNYINQVIYWPVLVLLTSIILFITWKLFDRNQPFYGLKIKGINWKPYWLMLLMMVPLIAAASTQADFLATYPKIKLIEGLTNDDGLHWWHKLLFELSYGSDFITIELFFRGFLVLAFIKFAGKEAILPMACFYCTIHFGKPLGECISSYFGGILLGIVVFNTRSILGGLLVHLGIAWMMELGGYIGNSV